MKSSIFFLLFVAMLSVSTSPIIARYLDSVPAVAISFWRMSFGATILWLFSLLKKQPPLTNVNFKRTILAGFFLGIHFALFFGSVKLTTIANATFLGTLAPIITFLIEKIFLDRKHSYSLIFGLVLAISGAIIIISNKFDFSSSYTLGNILAVLSSVFIGIALIISENVRQTVSTISYSRTLFTAAAFTLFGLALVLKINLIGFSYMDFCGLFFLGIVPTLLGHGVLYYCLRYISPTIIASIPMGEPIIASIMAYFLFQEAIGPIIIMGGSITFIGLLILTKK